ncbi:MAG: NADH-quinone oxidoreductase subunit NuoH [Anaerolineaceae bacterium]|nr:NADH-quinone oxidoreductase subunit NuoH [Anaerolineaceae bacterium]
MKRILTLVGWVIVIGLVALAVLTVINHPDPPLTIVGKVVVLLIGAATFGFLLWKVSFNAAIAGLIVFSVLAIFGGNFDGLVTGGYDATVQGLEQVTTAPENVSATANIVDCAADAGCQIVQPILYSVVVFIIVLTGFAYTTLLERRFLSFIQQRIGPNRAGPLGLLQPVADAIKLIFKEDIRPAAGSFGVWFLAPIIKVVPVLLVLAVIPLGGKIIVPWFAPSLGDVWYRVPLHLIDPKVGVLWILAITSIGTYGVVLAGWASNNKYAMLGGLRASAQMISYELSLGLTMAVPILLASSMSLGDIINKQVMVWDWYVFQNPLAAGILIIALMAEISRAPFDLPEAEQELTQGFMTEYSGMKFALFMMAEYLGMIVVSLVIVSLYFGGYQDGFGLVQNLPLLGPLVVIGKVFLLLVFMVWARGTLPRIRYDRLMDFGWKVMLPLALVAVAWTAIAVVVGDTFADPLAYGVISGIFFLVVLLGGGLLLSRMADSGEPDLESDPVITGERSGIGYGILQVIGALVAALFGLYGFLTGAVRSLASLFTGGGDGSSPAQSGGAGD